MKNKRFMVRFKVGALEGEMEKYAADAQEAKLLFYTDASVPAGASIIEIREA